MWSREVCHCGGQVYVYDLNGEPFTRGLCQSCDEERCDVPQEGQCCSCDPEPAQIVPELAKAMQERRRFTSGGWLPSGLTEVRISEGERMITSSHQVYEFTRVSGGYKWVHVGEGWDAFGGRGKDGDDATD